jgi:hypothetical protein
MRAGVSALHGLSAETGTPAAEVCGKLGVSEQTFYRWKRRSAGAGSPSWGA